MHISDLNMSWTLPPLDSKEDFLGKVDRLSLCVVITKMFLSSSCITAQELKSLFEKKSLKEKPPHSGKQSILSVRLEQCPLQLNNPFNEYSKFDGKVSQRETIPLGKTSVGWNYCWLLFLFLFDLDLGFQKGLSKYRMSLTFPKTEGVKRCGFGLNVVSTVICLGG